MRIIFVVFVFIVLTNLVNAQYVIIETSECDSLNELNKYNEAIECYKKNESKETYAYRNISILYGHLNNIDSALIYLNLWLDKGNIDLSLIEMTPFDSFKDIKEWQDYKTKVLHAFKLKNPTFNIDYYNMLINLYKEHIYAYTHLITEKNNFGVTPKFLRLRAVLDSIDAHCLNQIETLFDTYGWACKNVVGVDCSLFATIILYESNNLNKIKKYYPYFIAEINKETAAEFEDRILVLEGKKQKYGSQHFFNEKTNKTEFYPIEDFVNVNKRRQEAGFFNSFEKYSDSLIIK